MYFFGSEKSAFFFFFWGGGGGSNFCQANSSYTIQAKVPARSERQKGSMYTVLKIAFLGYKSHVFFLGLKFPVLYVFGCTI